MVVQVCENDEVSGLHLRGGHCGLPDDAFLLLAVADDNENVVVNTLHPAADGHAEADGDAVAQRAGHGVNAGDLVHVGVTLKEAADRAQTLQLVKGEIAAACKRCVKNGAGMTLGKHKTVALRPAGLGGVKS